MPPKRNLLFTKTAIATYVSLCSLLIAVSPNIEALASRKATPDQKANTRDWIALGVGVASAVGTLLARYGAGGTYTPRGIPGDDPVPPLQ